MLSQETILSPPMFYFNVMSGLVECRHCIFTDVMTYSQIRNHKPKQGKKETITNQTVNLIKRIRTGVRQRPNL